jgi:hypothetical protein
VAGGLSGASVSAGVSSVDDRYGTKDVLSLSNQCIQMGDTRIPTSILLPRPCGASLAQTDREPVDGEKRLDEDQDKSGTRGQSSRHASIQESSLVLSHHIPFGT